MTTPRFSAGDVRRRTLEAMRASLLGTIIPELSSDGGKTAGHVLLRLTDHLIANEIEAAADAPDPALSHAWTALSGQDAESLLDPAALERVLPEILVRKNRETGDFLERFLAWQTALLVRRDPEAAGGVAEMYRGGKTSKAEQPAPPKEATPELTPERLTAYLRRRFPERPDVVVTGLTTLPGGFSKQTVMVTTRAGDLEERFVIRKDFPVSPTPRTVVEEFPLLRAVWQAGGVQIAEPLWLEADPAEFGTPMMAVALAEGSGNYASWVGDPEKVRRFGEDLARTMARLHSLPLQATAAGELRERRAEEHVAAEIDRWYTEWQGWKVEPRPLIEAVYAWLKANIPTPLAPAAIVHGDIGFHNMLMQDGRLTALLDWEFSHIGDPAEDLVYCRFFVEQVIDWESFLAIYEAEGGKRPSPEAERFYLVWQGARNSAGCGGALNAFLTKPGADAKLGVSGMTFLPRFELDAFAHIVKG